MNKRVGQGKYLIAPSLMCGNWLRMGDTIAEMENAGVELLHIDVMDGHFVPNITFGISFINEIKACATVPLDIHIMSDRPETMIERLQTDERDYITVHHEAIPDPASVIESISAKSAKPGVALKPETDPRVILPYVGKLAMVLLMMTRPGSYGQPMESGMYEKIAALSALLSECRSKALIEVDGCVSCATAPVMRDNGARIFVGGTASIFSKGHTPAEGVSTLRAAILSGNFG